jgi:UDP-N-acetylmuramate--alanine ligase
MQTTDALRWDSLPDAAIHMVGIKGTGMAALAAALHGEGACITGSDTGQTFYTDAVIRRLGLTVSTGFQATNVPATADLVIHSVAFERATNPELIEATRRGLPVMSYPEALGRIAEQFDASGVAGSHGKTSTTALCAVLAKAIGLPATVLVPSLLPDLDDLPVYRGGRTYFVTETCEYRRSFLAYRPRRIVMTTIEAEHLDYYRDYDAVCDAFVEYARLLPPGGALVYNADDPGCRRVVSALGGGGLTYVPFGRTADGPYRILSVDGRAGHVSFRLAGDPDPFELTVPGEHNAHNATAAIALVCLLAGNPYPAQPEQVRASLRRAVREYRGCRRRCEHVGTAGGVTVLDDYGHHPTEIATTLAGLRSFYPQGRLVVDFMPHLYSRTRAFFDDFVRCFDGADAVVLHRVYPSAREIDDGSNLGRRLAESMARRRPAVRYDDEPHDSLRHLLDTLKPGDTFLTVGAGDNWTLGLEVLRELGGGMGAGGQRP